MPLSVRSSLFALATIFIASSGMAHMIVDVKMSIVAPSFVAAGQRFSYQIVADNLANDDGEGIVVTDTLPSSAGFVGVSGTGWTCSEATSVVTCSAEQLPPGPNVITIDVIAPAASGPIVDSVTVESLETEDLNPANDSAAATTTIFDPAACPIPKLLIVQPAGSGPIASPARLSWTVVPNVRNYNVYAAVEGERSALVATTTDTSIYLPFERGNVEWHVEAFSDRVRLSPPR